ncbi:MULTISPECIES: DUF3718 domain-containing protein [Shewanella]|uniref:DUF3718 domain-containing protein n=1 Tax=Shewanella TaxID=22 RepID=UPI0005A1B486|nr:MULTISPECIES: DUF3718 domain-containing protein [Shewanella]KIO37254.1 hypothetical protein DB48_05485 [Shewanella sp. cp20]MCG9747151.1 DUF3718 domain-containing protein [Shewanella sp. Isolate8]MCL2908701.1 DUF3718 domain-containing protein [Shewanella aquimarina]
MKKLLTIAAIALAPLAFSSQAAMSPQMEKTLVAVCKAGASNNMVEFSSTLREYRINKQRVFPRLVCNDQSFHQFALSNGADRTAAKIAPYALGTVTIKDIAMNYGDQDILAVNF